MLAAVLLMGDRCRTALFDKELATLHTCSCCIVRSCGIENSFLDPTAKPNC